MYQSVFQSEVDKIKANKGIIQPVSAETFTQFLECVPPVYFDGGFACGEPYSHTGSGIPVYYCFARENGNHYGLMATIGEAKLKFAAAANFNI